MESEIAELKILIDILQHPERFAKYGATLPKGVLIHGDPGTGKTMLVRALSNEIDIPFYPITADDILFEDENNRLERLQDVFALAEKNKPAVIFIDEIDTFLGLRKEAHDSKMLNQLLTLMDGFYQNDRIIVVATTSIIQLCPDSLLRPGRFDKLLGLEMPALATRIETLLKYTESLDLSKDVSLRRIASSLKGKTVPEIKNIVNEVTIAKVKDGRDTVTEQDFFATIEKVELGLKRDNDEADKSRKRRIALHEAGHALMDYELDSSAQIVRISIVKSGYAAGNTWRGIETDNDDQTRSEIIDEIKVALAGIAAEDVILGEHTNGGISDIRKATSIAIDMVKAWGMSELGVRHFQDKRTFSVDLISDAYMEKIDTAVSRIVNSAFETCKTFMRENQDLLETIADVLLEQNVLFREDLETIVENHKTNTVSNNQPRKKEKNPKEEAHD